MSKSKDREEFVFLMTLEYGERDGLTLFKLRQLMRLAAKLHRLAERDCNVGLTEKEQDTQNRAQQAIRAICQEWKGCEPVFSGDPRGAVVKLKVRSGRTNDWGGEGICVP